MGPIIVLVFCSLSTLLASVLVHVFGFASKCATNEWYCTTSDLYPTKWHSIAFSMVSPTPGCCFLDIRYARPIHRSTACWIGHERLQGFPL